MALITVRPEGLFCEVDNFYIDPWRSVDTALITQGQSDTLARYLREVLNIPATPLQTLFAGEEDSQDQPGLPPFTAPVPAGATPPSHHQMPEEIKNLCPERVNAIG